MSKPRNLARAPIQEALIDIRFDPVQKTNLEAVTAQFASEPGAIVSDLWEALFELKVDESLGPQARRADNETVGKRVDIPAKCNVLQLKENGFAFSRLPPYLSWEEMELAALESWRRYAESMQVEVVNRLAVRYINVIHLPLPIENFSVYLNAAPIIPEGVASGLSSFLSRVVLPREQDVAVVTQSLDGEFVFEGRNSVKLVLDIDVFHNGLATVSGNEIHSILERLRQYKNDIFFAFLTEATLGMFE